MQPEPSLTADALSLAAPWCAGLVLMFLGAFLLLVRGGRRPEERPPRALPSPLEDRLQALGFRGGAGRWEGEVWGRPVRLVLIDEPHALPPVLQELSTPVATGDLHVHINESEQSGDDRGRNKLGDPAFDRWYDAAGTLEELSVLEAPVRRALANAAHGARPRIEHGTLFLTGPGDGEIDARLAPLVSVATALDQAAAMRPDRRIGKLATSDPEPAVRLRFLELASPALPDLARDAADDPDPAVRTQAALLLADPVRLLAIAKSESLHYRERRKAARALIERGTDAQRLEAAVALTQGHVKLHPVAFELVLAAGAAGAEPVLQMLAESPNPEVARDAAARLSRGAPASRARAPAPRSETHFQVVEPVTPPQHQDPTMVHRARPEPAPPSRPLATGVRHPRRR